MSLDTQELRAKYEAERLKRQRTAAPEQQYSTLSEESRFADYAKDPNGDPDFFRDPITDNSDIIIVGAGLGSIVQAVQLCKAGISNFRIIDMAADFGGTWYWNRYPGARCDIESYVYIPLLEELGVVPTERYASGDEIRKILQALATKFGLYEKAIFQTKVIGANWNQSEDCWSIETDRGDSLSSRFLITLLGVFPVPRLANIPGMESFKGKAFHTARWDYDYTGGDSAGGLTGLSDKRVAIVGTGSTGIQIVPPLAEYSKELYVIQRTPVTITFRNNRPTDQAWAESLEPGWQEERMQNFVDSIACKAEVDLVDDGWTHLARRAGPIVQELPPEGTVITDEMKAEAERKDMEAMQEIRDRIAAVVKDQETAEALKPYYPIPCKRPGFSDDYLQTFNRSNVHLVDTGGKGVTRITEESIICGNMEIEVDCIIFATGFDVNSPWKTLHGFDVKGIDGLSLSEKWEHGFKSMHGMHVAGFPNFFPIGYHGNAVSPNYTHGVLKLCENVTYVIEYCLKNNIVKEEVEQSAEDDWVEIMREKDAGSEFLAKCTPGYYNNDGIKPDEGKPTLLSGAYGGGPTDYFNKLQSWRDEGNLKGLKFKYADSQSVFSKL